MAKTQGISDVFGEGLDWVANVAKDVWLQPVKGLPVASKLVTDYVLKPTVRESMAASIDAQSLLVWTFGNIYEQANPKHFGRTKKGKAGQTRSEFLTEFKNQFITGTRQGLQGLGTGFMPGPGYDPTKPIENQGAYAKSQAGIQQARPRIGSHVVSPGRVGAYPLVSLGIVPQDSILYNIISGGIDAFVTMKNPADIFNWIPFIRPGGTGKGSMAAAGNTRIANFKEFNTWFDDLENRALGLMDDRPQINPALVQEEGVLFHGTSTPLEGGVFSTNIFDGGLGTSQNLMGKGIYLSDSPTIGASYTAKGATTKSTIGGVPISESGKVYKTRLDPNARMLDLRQPAPSLNAVIRDEISTEFFARNFDPATDDLAQFNSLLADPNITGETIMGAFRRLLEGTTDNETLFELADETLTTISEALSKQFDGLIYQGGVRRGGLGEHTAYTILNAKVLNVVDSLSPTTPRLVESSIIDAYNRITQPVAPKRTKPYPDGSPNAGKIADTYEPSDIYNYWKDKLDVAYGDKANNAGIIRDIAPAMLRNQYTTWKESGDGVTWANKLLAGVRNGELDLQTLWKSPMFGREGLTTVKRLTTELVDPTKTADDVFKILDESVASFDPALNVRNLGASQTDLWRTGVGINIKTSAQKRGIRQLEVLPESLKVGRSDPAQSARNLDDLMGTFKFGYKERGEWLTRFANDVTGTRADLFNFLSDFTAQAIRSRLENVTVLGTSKGVFNDEEIQVMTSWTQKLADEVSNYTKNDLGQVVPLPWIESGKGAPLRTTQLLSQDQYMISPDFIDDVIQATGTLGAFVKSVEKMPVVGGAIRGIELTSDVMTQYMSRIWKPSRVAKPSHLLRVTPEESARALASGIFEHPMEYMLAMLGRTLKTDAKGVVLSGQIPKIVQMHTDISKLEFELLEAKGYLTQAGFEAGSGFDYAAAKELGGLTKLQQKLVARIPKIENKISDLEAKLNAEAQPLWESVIGPRSRGSRATATGEWLPEKQNMLRSGSLQLPDRTILKERKAWVRGLTHELADMADNADYRRLAASKLKDDDLITVGDETLSVADHVAQGTIHPFTGQPLVNDLDAIKLWLFQGGGRSIFESYFDNVANLKLEYQNGLWDDYAVASDRVGLMLDDITSKTGGDSILNEVIATRKYDGVRAVVKNFETGRGEASKSLREYLSKTFIDQPYAPRMVEFHPDSLPGRSTKEWGRIPGLDRLLTLYFEDMYGRASDFVARVPVWKAGYWTRMEELVSYMKPAEAQKVVEAAKKAALTPTRMERIELQAALANGEGTLQGATLLAESYARRFSKDLLFDASKRTLFGRQHRLLFPFFEAFREVTGTWLKLAARNPRIIRNTGQFVQTSQENGWFYTDDNERKVFEVPMTSALARIFTGSDSTVIKNFTVGVNAVNIAGQMRPGIGPVVQVAADMFLPKDADTDWLREIISPFGDPDTEQFQLQSVWAPKYLKQLFAETQSVEGVWAQVSKAVVGDIRKDDYYQRAFVRIMQHNANTNEALYQGADGMKRLWADTEAQALRMATLRGIAAFAGPGAPMTTWMANTKEGVVEVGILAGDLYTRETAAMKRGQPRYKGFEAWLDYWGEQVWPYVGSLTESTIGGQIGTTEFERWSRKNEGLLKQWPLLGGYLGPREGVRNFDAWAAQMDAGRRRIVDPEQALKDAQNRLGKTLYRTFIETIPVEYQKTDAAQQLIADKMIEIGTRLPGWGRPGATVGEFAEETRRQITELRLMVADKKLGALPVMQAAARYLAYRDEGVLAMIKADRSVNQKNWMTVKTAAPLRDWLATQIAPMLIAAIPAFQDLWDRVLSYEFQVGG